jgi:hypothetical protein
MPDETTLKSIAQSIDDLAEINKKEFEKIDARFENVERSLDEIKMKFAYTAWAIDLKDLEKRVKFLEDKVME